MLGNRAAVEIEAATHLKPGGHPLDLFKDNCPPCKEVGEGEGSGEGSLRLRGQPQLDVLARMATRLYSDLEAFQLEASLDTTAVYLYASFIWNFA